MIVSLQDVKHACDYTPSVCCIKRCKERFWHQVLWSKGATTSGSSGSPLIDMDTGKVVAVLTGGFASCSDPRAPDYYGRLSAVWHLFMPCISAQALSMIMHVLCMVMPSVAAATSIPNANINAPCHVMPGMEERA